MKNLNKKIAALLICVFSLVACMGLFAACQEEARPVHVAAKEPDCTHAGNIEYWVKDGKYYSDEACTTEIAQEDTVRDALDHDFENGEYVSTDETQHWKVCARTGCNEISTKESHDFTSGDCVCGKAAPAPEVPQHFAPNAPTCGKDGNKEYWVKGGKYYDDEECTHEITKEDTVDPATGLHTPDTDYTQEQDKHYRLCSVCGLPAEEKADHTFTNGTCTVCHKTNGFENTTVDADSGVATREDSATSVKITVNSSGDDWKVKFNYKIEDLAVGDAFVIKYKVTSSVSGKIAFETNDGKDNDSKITLAQGEGEIVAYGLVRNEIGVYATLKIGNLAAGSELVFTQISYEKLTLNSVNVDAYNLVSSPDGDKNIEAQMTRHDGWFNITATKGPADAWRIKLEHSLNITANKTYDMVYVIKVNSKDITENMTLEIGDGAGSFVNDGQYYWLDANAGDTIVVRFRFTANSTNASQYSCLQLGNLANQSGQGFNFDFLYISLTEVA